MEMTIDIPAELIARAEIAAKVSGIAFDEFVCAAIVTQLDSTKATRSPLPHFRKASRNGSVIPNRTNAEIEKIFDDEVNYPESC